MLTAYSDAEARVLTIPAGTDKISSAVLSATGGDTLVLSTSGGIYHETKSVALPAVPLTIMADSNLSKPPAWTTDGTRHLRVYQDLTVKGIRFDGRNRTGYAIRSYATRPNKLVVTDCEIAFFTKDGVTDNDVPVGACIVRNTTFHDIRGTAIGFRTEDMCRDLMVEDCTFYRLGEHAVHIKEKAVPAKVRISNITVHNSKGGIYIIDVSDVAISNSIITGCSTYAIRSLSPTMLTHICTFWNQKDYDRSSGGEGCFNADPRYYNAEAGDFSLLPDSPCLKAGRAGEPLGDRRWTGAATRHARRQQAIRMGGVAVGSALLVALGLYTFFVCIRKYVRRQEEKKIYETLKVSQERYALATQAAKGGVWDWNIQTGEFYLDPNIKQVLGYEDEEIPNDLEVWVTYVLPEDREAVMAAAQDCLEGRTAEYVFEHRMLHKDGSIRWVLVRGKVVRDKQGAPIRMVGTDRDITEHRQAEEALRKSEERFRNLVEQSNDIVWEVDTDGVYTYCSPKVRDILGYAPDEMTGKTPFDFMPAEEAERVAEVFSQTVATQRSFTSLEHKTTCRDGHEVVLECSGVPIFDSAGHLQGYRGIDRDITERKQTEKMQKEFSREIIQLQEEERKRVARELHDGVSQILSSLKFRIEGVEEEISHPDEKVLQETEKTKLLLDEAIQEIQRISQNLRPSILDDLGLKSAVRSFCEEFMDRTHTAVKLDFCQFPEHHLPSELETTVYRSLQEALNNVEKHAQATKVRLCFSQEASYITMTVKDNGKGFELASIKQQKQGIGLRNIEERVAVVNGVLTVQSSPGRGTEVCIKIPFNAQEGKQDG